MRDTPTKTNVTYGVRDLQLGMENRAGLSQLRELDLSKTQITDTGLKYLRGLKQLQYLNLHDTNVTRQGVQDLKQAMPSVNVVR